MEIDRESKEQEELEKRLLDEAKVGKILLFRRTGKYSGESSSPNKQGDLYCGFIHRICYKNNGFEHGVELNYTIQEPDSNGGAYLFLKTYKIHSKNIKEFKVINPSIK